MADKVDLEEIEYLELEEIDFDEDIPIIGEVIPPDTDAPDVVVDENELFEHGDCDYDENIDFEIPTIVSVDEEGIEHVKGENPEPPSTNSTKKYPQRIQKDKAITNSKSKSNRSKKPPAPPKTDKTLICRICSKMYQREYAFYKHQTSCK